MAKSAMINLNFGETIRRIGVSRVAEGARNISLCDPAGTLLAVVAKRNVKGNLIITEDRTAN